MWLNGLLGVTVIKDRQQAQRPPVPYGMVDLASWGEVHEQARDITFETTGVPNSEGKLEELATPSIEMEWVFLFMLYGEQGEALMRRVQAGVHLSQIQEPLRPNLVVHEVSRANSIPELVHETWEPRTQVNIFVRGMSSDSFVVDVIEQHNYDVTGERA